MYEEATVDLLVVQSAIRKLNDHFNPFGLLVSVE